MTSAARLDEQRVAAARLWGALRFPYLASALFASSVVASPGLGSIAVDRSWRLYMDPALVDDWSSEEIGSVLVHHVGHLLRDHGARAQRLGIDEASEGDWVAAADAEINDDLVDSGVRFPMEPIVPSAFDCAPGKFAEDYFHRIRGKGVCPGECGSGAHGQARGWELGADGAPEVSPAAAQLLRCKVASDIRSHGSELPGSIPKGWQRWADELLEPRVDWRKTFAAAVRTGVASVAGCVDYSYMRPSRRASVTGDVILPALRHPLPTVAVVIDTSDSMSERLLGDVVAEVDGILRGVGVGRSRVHILACDAEVHKLQRVTSARQVQLFGGGGTSMTAGIEAAHELRPRPSVIVVLTDGYTSWPSNGPKGVRVVVGLVGGGDWPVPDWAKLVRIEDAA
ncbi:MAG: VWA-like domain-containing protein [Actinomycetota bacterium]|nr:VWA-like domain-containing protein [Actinomycetota bacterium]